MSGYFDALLRSAGSPLAASPSLSMPAVAPAADAAALPEQEMTAETETLASLPDASVASRPPLRADESRLRVSDPVAVEETGAPHGVAEQDQSAPPRRPEIVPPPFVPAPLAAQGEMHPVVRAALRWVTADPVVIEREVSTAGPTESTSVADRAPSPTARTSPLGSHREANRAPHQADDGATTQMAPIAAARELSSAEFNLDVTWPISPPSRRTRADVSAAPPAAESEPIEIHIGTIHVAVDAPAAPRATVQPAVSSPPPPMRSAPRSAFGRSRLPRL